jgi:hypothetical protein
MTVLPALQAANADKAQVTCANCRSELPPVLARLGSLTCHDCRPIRPLTIGRAA